MERLKSTEGKTTRHAPWLQPFDVGRPRL